MESFLHADTWFSLLTLIFMEIILGVDNIVFISILVTKLPLAQQKRARNIGILLALIFRIVLLMGISQIAKLTTPFLSLFAHDISARDFIMLVGGLFLMAKATIEIHKKFENDEDQQGSLSARFWQTILQIVLLDVIFSLDSVITAVGMVDDVKIMVIAVVVSLFVMLGFSSYICNYIDKHPTMKMLALSFLLMIGLLLFVEGLQVHVPKGYIYFAMAFSVFVEMLNSKLRKKMG